MSKTDGIELNALTRHMDQRGTSLAALTNESPVLLVFLRHTG